MYFIKKSEGIFRWQRNKRDFKEQVRTMHEQPDIKKREKTTKEPLAPEKWHEVLKSSSNQVETSSTISTPSVQQKVSQIDFVLV